MEKILIVVASASILLIVFSSLSNIQAADLDKYFDEEYEGAEQMPPETANDPLEPLNRFFFNFNDKLYFWAIKPASQVYAAVLPVDIRMVIRNAFNNIQAPVRIVNNFLQGKVKNSGIELTRFVINSTAGIAGLVDSAKKDFGIEQKEEDLGQTFGFYGAGEGVFICWPILGASNLRDTVGMAGDAFLNPVNYLFASNGYAAAGIKTGEKVNETSLTLGDYERFKEAAVDPYVSMRQAYRQSRDNKIKDLTTASTTSPLPVSNADNARRLSASSLDVSPD
jgi:phospholipid-binding lipoprotein MlaA